MGFDKTNIYNPSNYKPAFVGETAEHLQGRVECCDCGGTSWMDGELRHNSYCEGWPKVTLNTRDLDTQEDDTKLSQPSDSSAGTYPSGHLKRVGDAGHQGNARAYYSDDDIFAAVQSGFMSESEALNQDC